jgi:hypothetical protein
LTLLLLFSFFSIWIIAGNQDHEPDWRLSLIQAGIVWGGLVVLGTELLSAFGLLNRLFLAIYWLIPISVGVVWIWIRLGSGKVLRLPIVYHYHSKLGSLLDMVVILILIITAVVAFTSPPNSLEALVTRMSRVSHWQQNQSLAHFATGNEAQNFLSPGADFIFLQLRVLAGHDRWVNLAAWLGFAGSIAAAASLANILGASINGQRLAAIFTATLPGAIVHATGATNVTLASFWVLSAVLMALIYIEKTSNTFTLILTGIAAGLAVLTQATSFVFLLPLGFYLLVVILRRNGAAKLVISAVIIFLMMGVTNAGVIHRNQRTYQMGFTPVALTGQLNEIHGWQVAISNIARQTIMRTNYPLSVIGERQEELMSNLHDLLEFDSSDARSTVEPGLSASIGRTSEAASGNQFHALLVIIGIIVLTILALSGKVGHRLLVYTGLTLISFLLFVYLLKWDPNNASQLLTLFILLSPVLGLLFSKINKNIYEVLAAVLLLVFALPFILQTQERPIIPDRSKTSPFSIFNTRTEALYFVNSPHFYKDYLAITDMIQQNQLQKIGLNLGSTSAEYPFWVFLGAPESRVLINWVETSTPSSKYLDQRFQPEVIICDICTDIDIESYTQEYEMISFDHFDVFILDE